MRCLLLVLVAACSSKAANQPAAPEVPLAPTCARTAAHMVDSMAAALDPRPPDAEVNDLIAYIRTRCEEDRWSTEAQQCLSNMKSASDADRCGTLLTPEQQQKLTERFGPPPPKESEPE